ncbi:hypothetical protein [Methylocystis parvus]|uniref:hypothetical protein n=1 Tax=Methylocystis parvus TaxID=134 RepID=UPI003C77388E
MTGTTTLARGFIVALALVAASGAAAFEGRYVAGSKRYAQDLVVAKRADGRFGVKAEVATSGCMGEFEGVGALAGDALVAEAKFENETCALTLRRTKKGVSVEEDHCLPFHGAACEFSGAYRKR